MNSKTKSKKTSSRSNTKPQVSLPPGDHWPSLYAVTRHWQSDIEFFENELNFFRFLIDKHLALLIEPKNIDETRVMVSHLIGLEKDRTGLAGNINSHMKHIVALVENPFAQNAQACKDEHERLENEVANFVTKIRAIKGDVFKITEWIIRSEKVKRLIDWA